MAMNLRERDDALIPLYENRELMVFVMGDKEWYNQVDTIWNEYIKSCDEEVGIEVDRTMCELDWEIEHGYCDLD